jgi:hypothetical protein
MPTRTVGDIITEVLVRNNRTTTDGFISDTTLKNWLKTAHMFVTSYYKWPLTEGRASTTFASYVTNEDGYLQGSYPEGWKSESIRALTIGGKKVQKTNFYKFQKFIEDNPSDSKRIFTDRGKTIYINPRIDLSGTVTAWGQYTPILDATDTSALTVFSDSDEEANEAIVFLMTGYLMQRQAPATAAGKGLSAANAALKSATDLLDIVWKRVADEQFGYDTTEGDGLFKRIDVVNGGFRDDILKRDQF